MTAQQESDVESRCVQECMIDQSTGYCVGCCRTPDEISFWTRYRPHERRRIMARLGARLRRCR